MSEATLTPVLEAGTDRLQIDDRTLDSRLIVGTGNDRDNDILV